ncbi:hypothetical protein PHYSODRAFT_407329, partial [Phytophthora sojae]
QLLLFLGGTGKSRVIGAVQALCESWDRPHCVVKTAMTGNASQLFTANTIREKRGSDALINLELLIVDEVSMMKKYQLAQLDIPMRVPGVGFGCVHVILVGDFLQL